MRILLTNDDGIHAAGLAAMEKQLRKLGNLLVVAPSSEQSGVSQSITFLRPIVGHAVYAGDALRGYAVDGTPVDAVKLGVTEYCDERPDLIVSGINGGLNAGINVMYSGTVGAAIEGAFFGINSVAISLEWDQMFRFDMAAEIALSIIRQILEQSPGEPRLYNVNIPLSALERETEIKTVPMATNRYGHRFVKRIDPIQRTYFWATNEPAPEPTEHATDVTELEKGFVTVTPLHYDLTCHRSLDAMHGWKWDLTNPQLDK